MQTVTRPRRYDVIAGSCALWACLALTAPAPGAEPETPPGAPTAGPVSAAPPPDTPTADAAPPVDPGEEALAQRAASQQTFVRLIDEERYDEALTIAAEIVDLSRRVYGDKSIELAAPLTNLATAQMHLGDLAGAEANYRAAIAILEAGDGVGSPRLVNPLVGLGETYMRGGLYEQANRTYRRALQANHAEAGFYNLEQLKILDGLAESYRALDRLTQANAQQRIQVDIQRRRSGPESPELVSALLKLGRWYNQTGQYDNARLVFEEAQHVLRESKGSDTTAMVDALVGEALAFQYQGAAPDCASTLKRALTVLDAQPEPDHAKRAEVLLALGDLYLRWRQPRSARERYAQAWQELSASDALTPVRERYFGEPRMIAGTLLPTVVNEDGKEAKNTGVPRALAEGFVVASLTVDTDGDVTNPTILEANPPGLLDKQVLRNLEFAVFRPRMVDGAVVTTEGMQFRQDFRYVQGTAASPGPAPREPAGEKGVPLPYPGNPDEPAPEH